ncbi:hypothetical protein NL676_010136 [Syzygium grande]|nr:hypothetical protein NL676_010136 [Syzygium grande]
MADKNQNQYHPTEVNGYHRSDQESLEEIEEARRKKKMKWTIGIIAFVIFQVVQGLALVQMSFNAPIRVKNTNWGPFKYGASTVNFTYGGVEVGQGIIPKGKANFKSTKKIDVYVAVSSANLTSTSALGNELNSGNITLNSQGELKGKVTVMFMFKKTKISRMNCTMVINTSAKAVTSVQCS